MISLPVSDSIEAGWLSALEAAEGIRDGRALHTVLAIRQPEAPIVSVVGLNDALLVGRGDQSVDTVANTLFPGNIYNAPEFDYSPDLPPEQTELLDSSAAELYETYRDMLPDLCSFNGNDRGTYFGRLVSWPGKTSNGYNQLHRRVTQLRTHRDHHHSAANAADFALEGIAELESDSVNTTGLQIYKTDDERQMAFPCLVHIDISVVGNRLNLLAIYRHWHLVHKAYGNLIGLTRLLHFMSQQTGYEPGELMIHATVANAEIGNFGHRTLKQLVSDVRAELLPIQNVS